jgi:hypothetical protein
MDETCICREMKSAETFKKQWNEQDRKSKKVKQPGR